MIPIIYSVIIIFVVALLSFILFVIGFLSYRKSKDIRLLSITSAFGIFFIKNLMTSFSLYFEIIPHGDLELYESIFDLVALALLLLPVFKKASSNKNT